MFERTSVKVTVCENITQKGIPNILVFLKEDKHKSSTNHDTNTLIQASTDVNGQVDFGEFDAHKNEKYTYYIVVLAPVEGEGSYDNPNVEKGQNNDMIFTAYYNTKFAVKFIPPPPYNSGDSLSVTITNAKYPTNIIKITNSNYQPSLPYFVLPLGQQYVNIDKYKSGIYTNFKDTIYRYPSTNPPNGPDDEYDVNW